MRDISSLPPEVLRLVFTFLPCSDLLSVQMISTQWRDLSKTVLTTRIPTIGTKIQDSDNWPSVSTVHCAAALVSRGYLPQNVMTKLNTRIQSL